MAKINKNKIINDAKARKDLRKEIVERLKEDKNVVKKYYKLLGDNEKKVRKYMDGLNNLIRKRAEELPLKYFLCFDEYSGEILEEIRKTIENPEEARKYMDLGLHKWFWKEMPTDFYRDDIIEGYICYEIPKSVIFYPNKWPDIYEVFMNWCYVYDEEEYKACEQDHIKRAIYQEKKEVEASIKEFMGEVLSK